MTYHNSFPDMTVEEKLRYFAEEMLLDPLFRKLFVDTFAVVEEEFADMEDETGIEVSWDDLFAETCFRLKEI